MGYLEDNLLSGEQIIHRGRLHWFIFAFPIVLIGVGVYLLSASEGGRNIAPAFIFFGLSLAFRAWLRQRGTELAVTNRRVVAKFGLIRRNSIELNIGQVESVLVSQGILGRIFGFGTLTIRGTGASQTPIKCVADPMQFRRVVSQQHEERAAKVA